MRKRLVETTVSVFGNSINKSMPVMNVLVALNETLSLVKFNPVRGVRTNLNVGDCGFEGARPIDQSSASVDYFLVVKTYKSLYNGGAEFRVHCEAVSFPIYRGSQTPELM